MKNSTTVQTGQRLQEGLRLEHAMWLLKGIEKNYVEPGEAKRYMGHIQTILAELKESYKALPANPIPDSSPEEHEV